QVRTAAVVRHERRIVAVENAAIDPPSLTAAGQIPLPDDAVQIRRDEERVAGMKRNVVNVPLMPFELADQRAIADAPELDEIVVAARGQRAPIRADRQGAHPAAMRLEVALGRRRLRIELPHEHAARIVAGEELALVKRQRSHPTAVSLERGAATTV